MVHEPSEGFAIRLAYIHGYIQAQVENFATSFNLPARIVAARLGELLCAEAGGTLLGPADSLSDLRSTTASRDRTPRALALAGSTHGEAARQGEHAQRDGGGVVKQRKPGTGLYWAKMTPEERKKEMARRARVAAKKGAPLGGYLKIRSKTTTATTTPQRPKTSPQGYWARMTPEERSAEMRRRNQVTKRRTGKTRNELATVAKAQLAAA